MKSIFEMNTPERRQYEIETFDAIMAARQSTTATRQMQPTGKRTIAIGRSAQGGAFVITCNPTLQPEPV